MADLNWGIEFPMPKITTTVGGVEIQPHDFESPRGDINPDGHCAVCGRVRGAQIHD